MAPSPRPSIATEPSPTDIPRQSRARTARRIFVVALAVFIGLGALNVYGVSVRTRSAAGGGYEVTVTYARVSRPGLATPFSFEVRRRGGFPEGLTVATLDSYFDIFDENGFAPMPVEETSDGERTLWRFAPSPFDTMTVSLDARIEPGAQLIRAKGRLEILPAPGEPPVVAVDFTTLTMP